MPMPLGAEVPETMPPRKASREVGRARTKTDTGGQVENTKAIGRTLVKELGKMVPSLREKGRPGRVKPFTGLARGGRSETAQATVYQKHRSLRSRKTTYRGCLLPRA